WILSDHLQRRQSGDTGRIRNIYKTILTTADAIGCDLIVMASHRPEMQDYLLGPNAARVVRHANQSVFVVRDD
ncbi:MAG: universal stress protein, partial [Halocynthiibacter sp.]